MIHLINGNRKAYELPSALADGTVIVIMTGFSRNKIKYQSSLIALAKAVRMIDLIFLFG